MKHMDKKRAVKGIGALLLAFLFGIAMFRAGEVRGASNSVPGTASDPLITKSYLDERLAGLNGGVSSGADALYAEVSMKKGQLMKVAAGGEIVLYSGNASVIGTDGMVNLTSGELFKEGNSLVRYNSFLSPSNECGLEALGKVTVFVRGGYTID